MGSGADLLAMILDGGADLASEITQNNITNFKPTKYCDLYADKWERQKTHSLDKEAVIARQL